MKGWHINEVIVESADNRKWVFPCNNWLDKKKGDGRTERDLFPKQSKSLQSIIENYSLKILVNLLEILLICLDSSAQNQIVYKLHITTSDIAYAGTDANVFINIFGDEAETGRYFKFISLQDITHF